MTLVPQLAFTGGVRHRLAAVLALTACSVLARIDGDALDRRVNGSAELE